MTYLKTHDFLGSLQDVMIWKSHKVLLFNSMVSIPNLVNIRHLYLRGAQLGMETKWTCVQKRLHYMLKNMLVVF